MTSIVVLGGGPAGLAVAWRLAAAGQTNVVVIERGDRVGGNAGSFVVDGIPVDYGSHRLHPACPEPILHDLQRLLGDDLLDRPRRGRIRLQGRWLHFPLRPGDLLARVPPSFAAGVLKDLAAKPFARHRVSSEPTFASVLERGLGSTICREFYFPYAEKIWGMPAAELDAEQARRRVSGSSLGRMIGRLVRALPGFRRPGQGRFFYPRGGFGQITEALAHAAVDAGVTIHLACTVSAVDVRDGRVAGIAFEHGGTTRRIETRTVLSTIPIQVLARSIRGVTEPMPAALSALQPRAMVLIYLTLSVDRFTPFDAHYFPERGIRITRLSEPKNYSCVDRPGRTVLCAELPCQAGGDLWRMSDNDLCTLVRADLEEAGLGPVPTILGVTTRRLPNAYPVYARGYRAAFDEIDAWIGQVEGLVTFGRQGLFVHDNTHHTLAMAYALAACLHADGAIDVARWRQARLRFEAHVVED